MIACETVPQSLQHCNFTEINPRHGVVTLFGYGVNVHVDRGHLTIHDGIGSERRFARFPRVGHGLKRLVVIGSDGGVSLAALRWLADQRVAFVMLDRLGKVLATTGPVYPSDARLRRAQSLAEDSGAAMRIAIELIRRKLLAQERLVTEHFRDSVTAKIIADQRHALAKANSKEEIRRYEAFGALAYWRSWHDLPIRFAQSGLHRVPKHWQIFGARVSPLTKSPRLAVNPPNAALNYLYAILEAEARLAISELGLDPGIGVLHNDLRTRDSLALDLLEPIRPETDAFLLHWLRGEPWQRKWFFEERNGNCRLTSVFAARLSETSKLWKQALGPLAEWIAHELWTVTSRMAKEKAPATRLTQNRKRKAKGIPPSEQALSMIRESHLKLPKPFGLNANDPIAQLRRANTQRRQFQIRKSWKAADNPIWLDVSVYRDKILPRLVTISVQTIASTLEVSHSHASNIRAKRCSAHQRHWLALADLVGVKCETEPHHHSVIRSGNDESFPFSI